MGWVKAVGRTLWVELHGCRGCQDKRISAIPVSHPLPGIAGHIIKAVTICRVTANFAHANFGLRHFIDDGKLCAGKSIRHLFALWMQFIAPNKIGLLKTAACCKFPFCFCWQTLACPLRVSLRIKIRNLHDWIIFFADNIAARALWMTPVSSGNKSPPARWIVQWYGGFSADEHHRAGNKLLIRWSWCAW